MKILVTATFDRVVKKMHRQQKVELDEAVRCIATDPLIGEAKVGDLLGIRVYKFRMVNQLTLLAYRILDEDSVKLLTVGSHENFYRDLRRVDN
ncbi:MAG: type II toxin-antitoxin system RelE/ParE family toxin [Ferrovum sp.]|jgi:mRNA-degrading endonuclease YafQ of YafQ-DinJ toxin-antitoxin module|nr:type II toxin-antitoxin system RelE/ParE family toxin [Ferrovum sp.]